MRPERSWRPIVTISVDDTQMHETVLGSDGQNVNMRDVFRLSGASLSSKVEVQVFHRPQSKKKGKKRSLVGSSTCSLEEMWKKHGKDPKLRLQCQNPANRSVVSRGRPQNGASIHLRLRPPASFPAPASSELVAEDDGYTSESSSSSGSCTIVPPVVEVQPPLRRRRRVRGYCINSDDEPESYSESDDDAKDETKPLLGGTFDDEQHLPSTPIKITFNPMGWFAAAILPQYTERIEVSLYPPSYNFMERAISTFTRYYELQSARTDSELDQLFSSLQSEWTMAAGALGTLTGINAAIFSISPGALFEVNPLAQGAVTAAIVASILGITCVAWLGLRYAHAGRETAFERAADIFSTEHIPSFFFFAISARIPTLLVIISGGALLLFLAVIAWNSWPAAVIFGCFVVGLLMGLQWLVFCAIWTARTARRVWGSVAGPSRREDVSEKC
ncbi:hypothetical protein C8F01DRAFT_1149903 [Mycena amicta]|nr:hypothetical protein C8F01DRAFT_1149903 [Mycena amicta]